MKLHLPPLSISGLFKAPALIVLTAALAALTVFGGCQTMPDSRGAIPKLSEVSSPKPSTPRARTSAAQTEPGKNASAKGNRFSYHYYLRGILAELSGDIGRALDYMEKAHESDPGSYTIALDMLRLSMDKNEDEKTLARAEELARQHPDKAEAQLLLGVARAAGKDYDGAARAIRTSLELDPSKRAVYITLLMVAGQNGRLDMAEDTIKSIAVKYPKEALPRYFLGALHAEKKEWDQAVAEFERAAEINPELDEQVRREITRVYNASGQTEKLVEIYKATLAADPADMDALTGLAEAYLAAKNLPKAKAAIEGIIRASDGEIAVMRTVARMYFASGYTEESVKTFLSLTERPDATPEDWYFAGLVLEDSGKKDEALKNFNRVPPDAKYYANAMVKAAGISKAAQDRAKAEEALDRAARKGEGDPNLYVSLATVFEEAKDFSKAESILNKALTEHENEPHLLFRLGVVYDRWGKKDEAIKALRQVVVLLPDSPEALNYLGYTFADLGINLDEAKGLIEKALKIKPGEGAFTDSLGWVYFKMGNFAKALETLKKAAEAMPDDPTILEHLGDAQLATGDALSALKTYEKALSRQDDQEARKGLEKKMETLKKSGKMP